MSEQAFSVDTAGWVAKVSRDPVLHRQRCVVEIVLNAVAGSEPLKAAFFLKGGILMGLAYGSPRQTTDIDLTTSLVADQGIENRIGAMLDAAFCCATDYLGPSNLVLRTQSVKGHPRRHFLEARFPALKVKVAHAHRGTNEERALNRGNASNVIDIDISFNEPINHMQILTLTDGRELYAYGLIDVVAEKFRALLQQVPRNRYRRQDIFDLSFLIPKIHANKTSPKDILKSLHDKCLARDIIPDRHSLDDPEVKRRSGMEWDSMFQEFSDVPDFEKCYDRVAAFYRSLPWISV